MADGTLTTVSLIEVLTLVQRRWRLRAILLALSVAGAVFAATLILFSTAVAVIAGIALAGWLIAKSGALSRVDAAHLIEGADATLDNLVVTAAELEDMPRPVRPDIRDEIVQQAAMRLARVDPSTVVRLMQPALVTIAVLAGCIALANAGAQPLASQLAATPTSASLSTGASGFTVHVTPPAYTRRPAEALESPVQVTVIAGSRVGIEAAGASIREWTAIESAGIEIRPQADGAPKFLSVIVVPDSPPSLRIVTPGKDVAFAQPVGQVPITIHTGDDLGLSSLVLRFTKASGGGENLAFTEGEVALRIDRRSDRDWSGQATLSLGSLGLADGDMLVYRALARDTNPNGAPVQSDQYLIEIGKNAQIADAGFSLPTEEKKYAISQQMVIYKTEQLIAVSRESGTGSRKGTGEGWLDQSRMIAMEQRMVRAEVVFLGGGEVEDELEEAARSDELTEGRLQNSGRAEMLKAINFMSRAEAQLNEGRATEALVFERQALASLERALDRRRYFLRTLPDRSRIDTSRRLTGERRDAQSWTRSPASASVAAFERQRQVMRELAVASTTGAGIDAGLAARVAAVDPAAAEIQKAAVTIASAATVDERRDAVRVAMEAMTAHALKALSSSAPIDFRADPLAGTLTDALKPGRSPR